MGGDIASIIIVFVCLIGSAFFSGTETAFSTFNRIRMKKLAGEGNKKAQRVMAISENYDKFISTVLIGNNIVNILLSSLATLLFVKWMTGPYENYAAAVSTAVTTVLVLIFGEVSPKTIAKEHADGYAMGVASVVRFIEIILTPFSFLFGLWKKLLDKIFKSKEEQTITDEELITIVEEAEEDGGINSEEGELIRSAISFNDITVKDIITPRVDVVAVDSSADEQEIAEIFVTSAFSRLPVYKDDIDNIVGILHEKDFYAATHKGKSYKSAIKKPVYTSEHSKISDVLKTFKSEQCHMSIVIDEFGGTIGIITMEYIIEELIGDVFDEHDEVVEEYRQSADGSYFVSCTADLDDFFDKFEIEVEDPDNQPQTLNGWVMKMLEKLPEKGDSFTYKNISVEVVSISEKRVEEVHVTVLELEEEVK